MDVLNEYVIIITVVGIRLEPGCNYLTGEYFGSGLIIGFLAFNFLPNVIFKYLKTKNI